MDKKLSAFTAFLIAFAAVLMHFFNLLPKSAIYISFADDKDIQKCVYLTFDDGPSDRVTPLILDVLDEENVKATFFIIGQNAESRKNIVRREFESGHTVAVHSYSHKYKEIYSTPDALVKDINKCNDVIYSITGKRSTVYRFPGGSYGLSAPLIEAVSALGMRYVDWNASVRDAEIWNATPKQLFDAAVTTSSDLNNVVLLCHDSTTKSTTAQALKNIIRYYKNKGYVFATF